MTQTYHGALPLPRTQPWSSHMSSHGRGEPIEILLVEDEPEHAEMTMEALSKGKLRNRISHVNDGVEALAFLRREGKFQDAPRPDLILLDLYMPRKDGREVLEEVKSDQALKRIPVIMLTNSTDEKDVLSVYDRHVNAYIVKPVDFEQLTRAVISIENFWFNIVKLPAA